MSKTVLWFGNTIVCGLTASFLGVVDRVTNVRDLIGVMAGAVGVLFGGLLAGYIATRFMSEATTRSKNVAYFCGVLLWSTATVFFKLSGS